MIYMRNDPAALFRELIVQGILSIIITLTTHENMNRCKKIELYTYQKKKKHQRELILITRFVWHYLYIFHVHINNNLILEF